jgi:hypothetical protein
VTTIFYLTKGYGYRTKDFLNREKIILKVVILKPQIGGFHTGIAESSLTSYSGSVFVRVSSDGRDLSDLI